MITNLTAIVFVTLVTNQVNPSTVGDMRFETHVVSQRHVISYTNSAQAFLITNEYLVSIERRKFVAVRTVKWTEVPMPASPPTVVPPLPGSVTNNFGSINQP